MIQQMSRREALAGITVAGATGMLPIAAAGVAKARRRDIEPDRHERNVTALLRALRAELGCTFTGIRSKASQSPTFNFVHAEVDIAVELPADIETRGFSASGIIIADIVATGPRTLAILAVED